MLNSTICILLLSGGGGGGGGGGNCRIGSINSQSKNRQAMNY